MNPVRIVSLLFYRTIGMRLPHTFWPGGVLFSWIRAGLMAGMGCSVGKGCEIEPHVDIGFRPRLVIGNFCQINRNVVMRTVVMGDYVMIAPGCVFLDRLHHFDRTDIPMALQGESERKQTVIGSDVWFGQNAVVMPGIKIGTGAVVGASAVVTRDVPDFAVVAGVPARVIRYRGQT